MNKENNRSAAGLRRSVRAERIRLREEWSALKETDKSPTAKLNKQNNLTKVPPSIRRLRNNTVSNVPENNRMTSDVLVGVVALVEVGSEPRALPLRAALGALGATVVPTWSPLVTHLVWTQGGCRATRAKARALASRLVSPLWVEACAAAARRLPEQAFPAAARASDLPSPRTLRQLLKRAEMENIPLMELLSDSKDDDGKAIRLRMSSETEQDTSTDTSHDASHDKSRNTTEKRDPVNGVTGRSLHNPRSEQPPPKSKRRLFTQRPDEELKGTLHDTDAESTLRPRSIQSPKLTPRQRKDLAHAARIARKLVAGTKPPQDKPLTQRDNAPKVVLTGMSRSERHMVYDAIKKLDGRVQNHISKKTTHVLMGSCKNDSSNTSSDVNRSQNHSSKNKINLSLTSPNKSVNKVIPRCDKSARTLNALLGAVRGCRILYGQWALDSLAAKKWLHHFSYEVPHLKKISQKARVERTALDKLNSEYAYDVFYGMRVLVTPSAEQRDAAIQLLKLCGAIVHDAKQDGGRQSADFDITIGVGNDEVGSKWVFDSVAAARMRTTRRYINHVPTSRNELAQTSGR